jgi:hypothetical protein
LKENPLQNNKLYPSEGSKVYFHSASVVTRNIKKSDKPIKGSSAHRTQLAKVDDGFLFIDKSWYIPDL